MGFFSCVFFKAYYYFILFWVLDFLNSLEIKFFINYTQYNENKQYRKEVLLLYLVCVNLSELLAGFLVIITKIKMKFLNEDKIRKPSKNSLKLIYNDLSKKKNKYTLIIFVSLLDFIGRGTNLFYLLFIGFNTLEVRHTKWIISIDLISRIITSRIILKTKLYKHHYVSLILCSIGFTILFIFAIQSILFGANGAYNQLNSWIYIIFLIIQKILFSIEDSTSKILLTNKFLLPHFLMFWKGLICFIMFLILIPILFFTSTITINNFESLFKGGDLRLHILIKIILIIFSFFQSFSIFKIINIFTPIHVGFLNVISSLFGIIEFSIVTSQLEHVIHLIFDIICLILIGFGTLIFTEILIINAWGLNENTKNGLLLKEQLDKLPPDCTLLTNDDEQQSDEHKNDVSQSFNENTILSQE